MMYSVESLPPAYQLGVLEGNHVYPLVTVYITMENHHAINGKIHYNWPFSIAMLNYQRVSTNYHFPGFPRKCHDNDNISLEKGGDEIPPMLGQFGPLNCQEERENEVLKHYFLLFPTKF